MIKKVVFVGLIFILLLLNMQVSPVYANNNYDEIINEVISQIDENSFKDIMDAILKDKCSFEKQ